MRQVAGRLKSDYRYSNTIVYNNFPWPEPNDKQRATIKAAAQGVLDARSAHPQASLADLYDPLTMPADLLKAHQTLDKAVDAAYGYKGANADAARVAFLFERYQAITSLLPAAEKPERNAPDVGWATGCPCGLLDAWRTGSIFEATLTTWLRRGQNVPTPPRLSCAVIHCCD